jgi:hypothetical protein
LSAAVIGKVPTSFPYSQPIAKWRVAQKNGTKKSVLIGEFSNKIWNETQLSVLSGVDAE